MASMKANPLFNRRIRIAEYAFTDIDQLVADFFNDVTRWHHDHGNN